MKTAGGSWWAAQIPKGALVSLPGLWEAKTSGQLYWEGPLQRGKLCSLSCFHGDGKCASAEMAAQGESGEARSEAGPDSQTQHVLLQKEIFLPIL